MFEVQKEVNDTGPKAGKWSRECSVEIKFDNIDHASKFAKVLSELLWDASAGGDFEIDGKYVGHDVLCKGIVLKAP